MSQPRTDVSPSAVSNSRQILFWGSAARLVVGTAMVVAVLVSGPAPRDVVLGLLVFPIVELAALGARGRQAPPMRWYGVRGHAVNWGIGIAAFALLPQAALLFYGVSILLAFARGYAGCEIAAISNWLRGRDDQIVCPIFSPIDHAEARRAGAAPAC